MSGKQTTRSKWSLLAAIGKPYAMDIIESLSKDPARFVDLKEACSHDSTLTKRLRELADAGLVKTEIITKNKRPQVHYTLTATGQDVFETVEHLHS